MPDMNNDELAERLNDYADDTQSARLHKDGRNGLLFATNELETLLRQAAAALERAVPEGLSDALRFLIATDHRSGCRIEKTLGTDCSCGLWKAIDAVSLAARPQGKD